MISISYRFALVVVVVFVIGSAFFSFVYGWANGIAKDAKRTDMEMHLKYHMYGQINDSIFLEWERISDTGESSRYYQIVDVIRYPKGKGYVLSDGIRIVQLPGCDWKYSPKGVYNIPTIK
jgi:hypothetical protein